MSTTATTFIPQTATMTTAAVPTVLAGQPHVIQVPVPAAQQPVFILQAPPQPQPVLLAKQPVQYQQPPPQQQPAQPIHIEINNTTAPPAAAGQGMVINNTTEAAAVPPPQRI